MFSTHITKLTVNFSQFHVLCIQETDYRLHFTCGGILYFLKHHKHIAQCINIVQMSANCVHVLPQNEQAQHACAPSWPIVATFTNRTYFLDNPRIFHVRDYSSVYLSINFIADADVLS
jgi:hypothetical protein